LNAGSAKKLWAILLAALALLAAGCGGSGITADKVATDSGASACEDSGYLIVYRADQSKHRVWDCTIHGHPVCVTDENGVASNVTAAARLIFADSLNGKPGCLG